MHSDSQNVERILAAAADAAARYGGITVQITLLTERGYRLWSWSGTPSEALQALARVPVEGGTQ